MKQYLELGNRILNNGNIRPDRTGTGTLSVFGHQMRFDLQEGFPLLTTKKMFLKGIIHELLWFLQGDTNNNTLNANGVTIWDEWMLTKEHLRLSNEEREVILRKQNQQLYKQYLVDLNWEIGNFASDGEIINFSNEEIFAIKELLLNSYKAPIYGITDFSEGDLGPIYSAIWRRCPVESDNLILINPKNPPAVGLIEYPKTFQRSELISNYVGDLDVIQHNGGIPYRIIEQVQVESNKNTHYKIQFLQTGYVTIVSRSNLKTYRVFDPYHPSLFGVAAIGKPKGRLSERSYAMWRNMIVRCYDKTSEVYKHYGAKGVYVSPRWLCFENFYQDLKRLVNYEEWAKNHSEFHLDKDYYGTNCYDVETTLFIPRKYNLELSKDTRPMKAISPSGEERVFITRKDLVKWLDVSDETLRNYENKVFNGGVLNGWKFETYNVPEGKLLRRQLYVDQINELIYNLKNKPYSRRHVISTWIPALLPDESKNHYENILNGKQVLPPCHCLFQFYVREMTNNERLDIIVKSNPDDLQLDLRGHHGDRLKERLDKRGIPKFKLDCQLYQRSMDTPLGAPYNIASYALLTMMIAQCVNMVPGEFIHTIGDAHVYANQIEKFKEQMLRTPRALPIMKINPEVKDIFAFKFEDFELTGYDPHPLIDYEISI